MTTRKRPKHYGVLGGRHSKNIKEQREMLTNEEQLDDTDYETDATLTCPACHSRQYVFDAFIGSLGDEEHYRCRRCGAMFSRGGDES